MLPDFKSVGAPSIYVVGRVSRAKQYQDWPELVRHFHIVGVYSIRNNIKGIQGLIAELANHISSYARNRSKDALISVEDDLIDIFDEGEEATGAKTFSADAGSILANGINPALLSDFMDVINELKAYKQSSGKDDKPPRKPTRGRRRQVVQQQEQQQQQFQQMQWGPQGQQQQPSMQWGKVQAPTRKPKPKPVPTVYRERAVPSPTRAMEERRATIAESFRRRYPGYRGSTVTTRTTRRAPAPFRSRTPRPTRPAPAPSRPTRPAPPRRATAPRRAPVRRAPTRRAAPIRTVNFIPSSIRNLKGMAGPHVPVSMVQQLAAEMRTSPGHSGSLRYGVYTGTSLGNIVYFCEGGSCGLFRAR